MCVFKTCNAKGVSQPCAVNPFATRVVHAIRVLNKRVACEIRRVDRTNRRKGVEEEEIRRQRWRHRRGNRRRKRRGRRKGREEDVNGGWSTNATAISNRWRKDVSNPSSASAAAAAASYAPSSSRIKLQLQCSLGGAAEGDALEWRKNDHRMEFHTREVSQFVHEPITN